MQATSLTAESPAIQRLWAYLLERFPPVAYTLLVVLFYGSAMLVASALQGAEAKWAWQPPIVILLVFFHLRVFDEHKDAEEDMEAHPERILSRGIVDLLFLRKAALIAILLQAGLSASLGGHAFAWWAACFGFSVLMFVEFGVGEWLRKHMMVYAISHNPITPLLALFAWASTGLAYPDHFSWYLASTAAGALGFEIGRKIRLPQEEQEGVSTYSKAIGRPAALAWLVGCTVLCMAFAVPIIDQLQHRELVAYGLLLPAAALVLSIAIRPVQAKHVELSATLMLLVSFVAFGVVAW